MSRFSKRSITEQEIEQALIGFIEHSPSTRPLQSGIVPRPARGNTDIMSNIILYTTEDGRSQIKLRADRQTVWLTQKEMAELFDVSVDNIGLHLKNLYQDGELIREATAEESSVVQTEGIGR